MSEIENSAANVAADERTGEPGVTAGAGEAIPTERTGEPGVAEATPKPPAGGAAVASERTGESG